MRSRRFIGMTLAALLAGSVAPLFAAPRIPGAEFRVNQTGVSRQRNPSAAFDASGRALVVWENDKIGLQGRFLGRDGRALGTELTLVANQSLPAIPGAGTVVTRRDPAVAFLPGGGFFLFWTEETAFLRVDYFIENREVQSRDVLAQRFDRDGQPAGSAFRVNGVEAGSQSGPRVVSRASDFLVVWTSVDRTDAANDGVFARLLARTGALGAEFKVSPTGARATNPAAAAAADGGFLVVWDAPDGSGTGVFAQLYDQDAGAMGSDFRVSTDTVGNQRRPAVAAGAGGDFLVVWQGHFQRSTTPRVFGQVVGKAGNLVGGQLAVSAGTSEKEVAPAVAAGRSGNYLVVWLGYQQVFPTGIFAQELDAAGAAIGPEVKLNRRRLGANTRISIVSDGNGVFLAPWEGFIIRRAGISAQVLAE